MFVVLTFLNYHLLLNLLDVVIINKVFLVMVLFEFIVVIILLYVLMRRSFTLILVNSFDCKSCFIFGVLVILSLFVR